MVELPRSLALVAACLNDDARTALIGLLSGELQAQVAGLVRRVDPKTAELDAYQHQLLAGFDLPPARVREEAVDEERESGDDDEGRAAGLVAVLAMLCATGPNESAGDLLQHLPLHLQGRLLPKLLKTSPLSASAGLSSSHRELIEALREAASTREEWGIELACQILCTISSTRQLHRLLTTADEVDHEAVVELQNRLFVFEDLLRLSDPDLQALLVQIDNHTLGRALLLTDKKFHNALLRNISVRRRGLIVEEGDRWSEGSTIEEIETAQQRIMAMARLLYVQGKITTYFGSVSRSRPGAVVHTEDEEEEVGEREAAKDEQESQSSYRGLLASLGMIFLSTVMIWIMVGNFSTTVRESVSHPYNAGKRDGGSVVSSADMAVTDGSHMEASGEYLSSSQSSGQVLPLQAVMEMPGQARIKATSHTKVVAIDEEDAAFEMRMGKVRTMVFDEDFKMKTPVVEVRGDIRGTLFDTRVVLNGTTTVSVIRGVVMVESLIETGQNWKLSSGKRGVFNASGNGHIDKSADEGE